MNDSLPHGSPPAERHRVFDGETLLGFIDYYRFGSTIVLVHTETNPALQGKGHGSAVAESAVAHFRATGAHIVPVCAFFAHFLRTRPQHHDMVSAETAKLFAIGGSDTAG
ncbi:hypothetical protein GCM10007205_08020 [Oxalicibacterium flavum]|uniref:N-acetyltransferase domain-containing protein n=1 Tax=Oxalicibacterium flavum TaxID=179467 RepID=A0A8J2UPD8_9BURK|nr:GNAT family N-acetyltransferase [Oxalicibacterium flavum]GGC01122.1 hypothetical protein GCM10007205_08020 [Oxalicibacterium flavum]